MDALVMQKNALLTLVNEGKYEEATAILNFLAPSWEAERYGYKVREIRERIKRELDSLIFNSEHHSTEAKWQRMKERCAA